MSELPGPPLRIAVLGDFDGPHTRAWVRTFVERGHEVHAISYYPPSAELPGLTLHVLSSARGDGAVGALADGDGDEMKDGALADGADGALADEDGADGDGGEGDGADGMVGALADGAKASSLRDPSVRDASASIASHVPPSLMRLIHAWRYRRAGLRRVLDEIKPDVFHAHYAVEHGFYGAFAGYHPYVISAWGSDLLVESHKAVGRRIAKWALSKADLITGNDASLVQRAVELGVPREKVSVVHLGIERRFLDAGEQSVNLSDGAGELVVISDRAHEPLYNVDAVLQGFGQVRHEFPLRLVVAGRGSQTSALQSLAAGLGLGEMVEFAGQLAPRQLAEALAGAQVYVSVPSSDSLALSNLEAMAAGAFPIVSDLPSVDGWIEDGVNGLRVPPRDQGALTNAIRRALGDPELRRRAAIHNRQLVEARGLREPNMLLMERHYYRLAGHPIEGQAI